MQDKVCIVVVFNFAYPQNIAVIRQIYGQKFSRVCFLVPFVGTDDEGVIRVYDSSYRFGNFFAQGLAGFYRDEYTHYVFVADDMVLNPALNETNLREMLELSEGASFITNLQAINQGDLAWPHLLPALRAIHLPNKYVNIWGQMPSRPEAMASFAKHGLPDLGLRLAQLRGLLRGGIKHCLVKAAIFLYVYRRSMSASTPAYPLALGYSDLVVVTRSAIKQFCHYAGLLSSFGLFAEVAVPTALALSAEHVTTAAATRLRPGDMWTSEAFAALEQRYDKDLGALLANFPEDKLFLHPVKISRWTLNPA